ncbi:hypothetical protein EDC01DRAFT_665914 [Geopyxis carbonaria]|nr:hypothetical protein EDC01DRAFT_665914 [Geopyxis carbonaria]
MQGGGYKNHKLQKNQKRHDTAFIHPFSILLPPRDPAQDPAYPCRNTRRFWRRLGRGDGWHGDCYIPRRFPFSGRSVWWRRCMCICSCGCGCRRGCSFSDSLVVRWRRLVARQLVDKLLAISLVAPSCAVATAYGHRWRSMQCQCRSSTAAHKKSTHLATSTASVGTRYPPRRPIAPIPPSFQPPPAPPPLLTITTAWPGGSRLAWRAARRRNTVRRHNSSRNRARIMMIVQIRLAILEGVARFAVVVVGGGAGGGGGEGGWERRGRDGDVDVQLGRNATATSED